jgi:hypothetical protein
MDSLHFCIAVAPLAVYFLMLGLLNLRRRPFLTTGARDAATLGIGIIGFIIVGPMELFFPEGAASRFGPWVWVLLVVFYGLCVSLLVLLMKPRLVVYNMSMEELRPILTKIAMELDPKSRWLDDALVIPRLKIHMHVESVEWLRNIQMMAGGNHQSIEGWQQFEKKLAMALRKLKIGPNVMGVPFLIASAALAGSAAFYMLQDPQAVVAALQDMLRG